MIIKIYHTIKLVPIFFLLVVNSLFSQNQHHQPGSVDDLFKEEVGAKRIAAIADSIRNSNFHQINYDQFKPYLEEAYEWERQHPDKVLLNALNLGNTNILIAENNIPEAIRCLQEIIKSEISQTQKDSISIYDWLYGLYSNAGAYSESLVVLQIRDQVIENVPDTDPMYNEYHKWRMGGYPILLFNTKQYKASTAALKKQIFYANKIKDLHLEAGALNNLGLAYRKLNKPDSAIWAFNESKVRWEKYLSEQHKNESLGDLAFLYLLDGNIGSAYNQKGEYKKAIPLIIKDLEFLQKKKDYLGSINSINELSVSHIGLKQYDKAISLLDSASQIPGLEHYPDKVRRIYESKIKALEGKGDINEAFQLYKILTIFNDSMTLVENNTRLAVLNVVYDVENKNRELVNQKSKVVKAEENAEQQKENQKGLIIGVLLMLLIVIILIVNVLQRRKRGNKLVESNRLIEHQKSVIEQALGEKETLLKEIHHRVKNNLQLISGILELQSVQFDDENVREVMEEGQRRIRSMSLIHEQLYQSSDLGRIDFRKYLNKLTSDIAIAFNNRDKEISYLIRVTEFSLDINTAVPLGLIVNELIINAYKHAFMGRKKGCITVDLVRVENEEIQLRIIDDGIGLSQDFNPHDKSSLGLRLVKGLIRQLDGKFSYHSKDGTQFVLAFNNKIIK